MSQSPEKCSICQNAARTNLEPPSMRRTTCPRCGTFRISEYILSLLEMDCTPQRKSISLRQRAVISSLLRSQDTFFELTEDNQEYFFSACDLSMLEKANKLLLWIEKNISSANEFNRYALIDIEDLSLHAQCWAMNTDELKSICQILVQRGLISQKEFLDLPKVDAEITAKGWEHLEQLRTPNKDSAQGFVAMWFASEMTNIYESVLAPAIQSAGYAPHRVDQSEHIGKIDDEIILQIRRSRFVVADATSHRGGVYYEAGFASGLGLPVFWTCREDAMKDLHFDVNHYNCIVWEPDKLDEFRNALARRIEAVLGRGPRPTS